jgi:hypothetical protein
MLSIWRITMFERRCLRMLLLPLFLPQMPQATAQLQERHTGLAAEHMGLQAEAYRAACCASSQPLPQPHGVSVQAGVVALKLK